MNVQVFLMLSLMMALIIALLFVINAVFARKISAKVRYVMWVVIMVGLLIPFRPMFGDGVIALPDLTTSQLEAVDTTLTTESNGADNGSATSEIAADQTPSDRAVSDVSIMNQVQIQTLVFIVWAAVAIGIIGYHLFQYLRFQSAIKRWGEPEEDVPTLELFERTKLEMNLGGSKVSLMVCGFVSTSMLTGFFKPVILLPERNYDDSELELIFRHELIHYRRKDLWIKLLSVIAIAIHWFNPLVYVMNMALQTEGEASCDQQVLEMSELKNRHFYAEVIISMIGDKKSGMTTLATNFYGGKKGIKKRLEEIMAATAPQRSTSYLFLTLVLLLTVMSGSVFATQVPTVGEQEMVVSPIGENDDVFAAAIAAVGGGTVVAYDPISDEVMRVYVAYQGDRYRVDIHRLTHDVVELVFDSGNQTGDAVETAEPTEVAEVPTEVNESQADPQVTEISSDEAVRIAMAVAPGSLVEVERDWENGRPAWWVDIRHNGMVHEFYIDMETGTILQHEVELDD
ncbi:MAG: M56 family metallopeptidase [Turicibacter sp.]|nr:M56 family metallopeptidase [Turicibacter sp.]